MKELEYPFDNGFIMKKKRSLKRQLLGDGAVRLKKRVAVLGGRYRVGIGAVFA